MVLAVENRLTSERVQKVVEKLVALPIVSVGPRNEGIRIAPGEVRSSAHEFGVHAVTLLVAVKALKDHDLRVGRGLQACLFEHRAQPRVPTGEHLFVEAGPIVIRAPR